MPAEIPEALRWPAARVMSSETPAISRLGGVPDVPADFDWPCYQGRPLAFLLQIDLAELTPYRTGLDLPTSGRLLFFFDADEQPWGFRLADAGSGRVIYLPQEAEIAPASPPMAVLPALPITFEQTETSPDPWSPWLEELNLTAEQRFELSDARRELDFEDGQIGGHAYVIQDPMEVDCELAISGIEPSPENYHSERGRRAQREAKRWRLLLQLPSYEPLDMVWGGYGNLYFWIKEDALAARDFSRVWTVLQTT